MQFGYRTTGNCCSMPASTIHTSRSSILRGMAPPQLAPQAVLRQAAQLMAMVVSVVALALAVAQLVAVIRMPTCIRKLDPYGKLCQSQAILLFD